MNKIAGLKTLPNRRIHEKAGPAPLGVLLWVKIQLYQRLLNSAAQQFWTSEKLPALFPSFLLELYSIVSCSVPLMSAAYRRAFELASTDPLAARTAEYLKQHIAEEAHHDEWLLNDLVASGMDGESVSRRWPSANVASLIGAQYCWIQHAHPAALFGYLAVIEGNPPIGKHLNEIQLQTGFPPEAFRCLHRHAEDDIEHLNELHWTVTQLPLQSEHEMLIANSALATADALIRILEDLSGRTGGKCRK